MVRCVAAAGLPDVDAFWSTDCVAHSSNVVKMAVPLAQALATLLPSGTVKA